jgi:hypothetical protein
VNFLIVFYAAGIAAPQVATIGLLLLGRLGVAIEPTGASAREARATTAIVTPALMASHDGQTAIAGVVGFFEDALNVVAIHVAFLTACLLVKTV